MERFFRMLTGDVFVSEGLITTAQLREAQDRQAELGGTESIARVLVQMGLVNERDRVRCLGKVWGIPYVDLSQRAPTPEALIALTPQQAQKFRAIPLEVDGSRLIVAMSNPLDVFVIDEMRALTGLEIEPMIAVEEDVDNALHHQYKSETDMSKTVTDLVDGIQIDNGVGGGEGPDDGELGEDDAPIIKLANLIVGQAVKDKASDIHIEPRKDAVVVRYRVDGVLHEVMRFPRRVCAPLISRFKIMSNMDIAEKRVPQDNRVSATLGGREYDFRVSTLPLVYGEKIVMRVLDKGGINVGLERLGFLPHNLALIQDMSSRSFGIILVTGPTGSGKSTTLYSILNSVNDGESNIITIEDPVEYELEGINQCGVNTRAGMTFAAGLRAMLRQDPDIIMVGEMRDNETATIAMEAALTGHLVLSTLHTNDAPSAPTRLIDMEVEPFLISSSIVGVLAQRLVRAICTKCKEEYTAPAAELVRFGFPLPDHISPNDPAVTLYRGKGCDHCKNTGYKGRTGVHELMAMSDPIRDEILKKSPSHIIRRLAVENGMRTLQMDSVAKILDGVTSVDEVLRVIYA
jgi:type IV pilus assembly protein PilB